MEVSRGSGLRPNVRAQDARTSRDRFRANADPARSRNTRSRNRGGALELATLVNVVRKSSRCPLCEAASTTALARRTRSAPAMTSSTTVSESGLGHRGSCLLVDAFGRTDIEESPAAAPWRCGS
jgi:hypothetical protein